MDANTENIWPDKPYRGLNYFRPQDRPLLAGRDDDVDSCATLLAHPQTRVLLLHGSTGCGKSSFLRAGLIPVMEEEGVGYLFLKTPDADDEALFIRCTEAPIDQIARQVFLFSNTPFELRTPLGTDVLALQSALLGATSWEDYLSLCRDEENLCSSLRRISEIIPQTLVLIVDQAEEVLTLNPGQENFRNRSIFFGFLRAFQKLEFDARIIVTLRTEYFGRFVDATQVSHRIAAEFQQFFLSELSDAALSEAITRPTSKVPVAAFGIPYAFYGFEFEGTLPQDIVSDITRARYSGPALPVLQLVCLGLYEEIHKTARNVIEVSEYTAKGGVEGQVIGHIKGAISSLYNEEEEFEPDIEMIRAFLQRFYTMQDDGTVVARTHELFWANAELQRQNLKIGPDALLQALASPQTMILRTLRTVKAKGQLVDELTLGHDSVALALERWRALDAEQQARKIDELRKQEVSKLEEEVSKSRGAYIELTKTLTTSLLLTVMNVLVAFMFLASFLFTDFATDPIVRIIRDFIPGLRNLTDNTMEILVKFGFAPAFAAVLIRNAIDVFKKASLELRIEMPKSTPDGRFRVSIQQKRRRRRSR